MPASKVQKYINECEEKYPGEFDYSRVKKNYAGCNSKVPIICKKHNKEFQQSMYILLKFKRNGCTDCKKLENSSNIKIKNEEFIHKVKNVFPDLNISFSKTKYINASTPVIMTCETHGDITIKPNDFFNSPYGCKECGEENREFRKIKGILIANGTTKKQFIDKAKKIHGNLYDYSNVIYKGKNNKVKIKCKKHGIFKQSPDGHINGRQGCPDCCRERTVNNNRWSKEDFVKKALEIHGDRYDYSKSKYINYACKIIITCKEHGDFEQKPNNHIDNKQGCPDCGMIDRIKKLSDSKKDFIEKARKRHGDKYDYSLVEYETSRINVTIICPKHGNFEQRPSNHINGYNCPKCNQSKGEETVSQYLNMKQMPFIPQKKFENCKGDGALLRFDFFIEKLNLCIEYDGEQHSRPVSIFGGVKAFHKLWKYDNIKNNYCTENQIYLIRIPPDIKFGSIFQYLDKYIQCIKFANSMDSLEFEQIWFRINLLNIRTKRLELAYNYKYIS